MTKKAAGSKWSPHARQRDLIVKRMADELLIYDVARHRAHSLGPMMAALWQRCDGHTRPKAITKALREQFGASVGDELVWLGLERLSAAHLLRNDAPSDAVPAAPAAGAPTRRQWLRQAAALGMAVASITVPTLAEAASRISNADCARRNPNDCGNILCSQDPGNVCKLIIRGGTRHCSCTQN